MCMRNLHFDTLEGYNLEAIRSFSKITNSISTVSYTLAVLTLDEDLFPTVNELHAMLKIHEQTQPKQNAPELHVIRAGKVQKKKNKQKPRFRARVQNQRKGKNEHAYDPKPKISPSPKNKNPAKDSVYHQSDDTGHWKKNRS
ncbi:hypothetical protein Tco_0315986 [Tanacetum coccineum]